MKRLIAGVFLGLCVCANGCGYTTHAYVQNTGYKTIYVTPFVNRVDTTSEFSEGRNFQNYYPLLENQITNAVVDKFKFDGNLRITKEGESDLVLKGELTDYRRDSLRDNSANQPQEYRITLFVNITLIDNKTQKVLWRVSGFAGDSSYYTTGNFTKSEAQSLSDACDDLARRIVEKTVEAW